MASRAVASTRRAASRPARRAPTIKGIFVTSHVKAVRGALGEAGMARLERHVGRLDFGATEDVPTGLESDLIAHAVRLLHPEVAEEDVHFEAGRLHYRNFTSTPWCRLLFSLFPRDFAFMMRHAKGIAEKVFSAVVFDVEEPAPGTIFITMENGGYPLDHFRGLFWEWMRDFGVDGTVVAQEPSPGRQEFVARWD